MTRFTLLIAGLLTGSGCILNWDVNTLPPGDGGNATDTVDPGDATDTVIGPDTICTGGTTPCGTLCVNTRSDPTHCGTCGRPCPSGRNSIATCTESVCGIMCSDANFADCDGMAATGCEADLRTPLACGNCSTRCTGMARLCVMGMCQ